MRRLVAAGDAAGVMVEVEHLAFVAELLETDLLYRGALDFAEAHGRYWREVRAVYKARAGAESLAEMESPWYFLAFILGHDQDS